ncbi:MAG: hypothetical protein R3E83_12540 [Burkholderiaceae bacterium]
MIAFRDRGAYYNRGESKLDAIRGLSAGQAFDYCGDSLATCR